LRFQGASQDGSKVFFDTAESLSSDDTDSRRDIYQRSGTTTTWLPGSEPRGAGTY
jgi:hypothetical protein